MYGVRHDSGGLIQELQPLQVCTDMNPHLYTSGKTPHVCVFVVALHVVLLIIFCKEKLGGCVKK